MSVTKLADAEALATVEAGLFSRGAGGQRGAGSTVETPTTFTRVAPGVGQAQVDTSAVVLGAAISSWKNIGKQM